MTTDIEEFTLHIDKFEKRGVDYFLNDVQIPSVSTILGSGGGGKASANGNALHEGLANYFLTGSTEGLFKDIPLTDSKGFQLYKKDGGIKTERIWIIEPKDAEIPIKLSKFLKENNLKPLYVEHKFYYEIDGCKFAGTIDLVCIDKDGNLYVFDYKTGTTKDAKHHKQVGTYAKSIGAIKGFIVYRDGIVEVDLSIFENDFKPLLLAYYGKLDGYINHRGKLYLSNEENLARSESIKHKKLEIEILEKQVKKLKAEIEEDKQSIIETLEKEKPFKDKNIMLIWNKATEKEVLDITPERVEEIRKNSPDWFSRKQSDGYYTLRLATENKETKECS